MLCLFVWGKYIDDFFINWKQDRYSLRYRNGDGEVNKEPCDVIDCYDAYGTLVGSYFFSKRTSYLLKKAWRTDGGRTSRDPSR
jgi:hypothetical protein